MFNCFRDQQLVPTSSSHASGLAEYCMGHDQLAGPCTSDVGVANSIGALWSLGGCAWVFCVAVCCCLVGGKTGCLKMTKAAIFLI